MEDEPGESMADYNKRKARKWQRLAAVPATQISPHSSLLLLQQKCRGDQRPVTQKESKHSKLTIFIMNLLLQIY